MCTRMLAGASFGELCTHRETPEWSGTGRAGRDPENGCKT